MFVSIIMEKCMSGFHENLQDMEGITQGIISNILGILHLSLWKHDFFLDPYLSATVWGLMDFL